MSIETQSNKEPANKEPANKVQSNKVQSNKVQASKVQASKVQASKVQASKVQANEVQANRVESIEKTQTVSGCVDGILCGLLTGWIYDPDNSTPEIVLKVDGVSVVTKKPNMLRPDVQEIYGTSGMYGFSFDLEELALNWVSEVKVLYEDQQFDFGGECLRYCPMVEDFRLNLQNIFFCEYYRNAHNLVDLSDEEVFMHYLKLGIYANFDPNPWFSSDYYAYNYVEKLDEIEIPVLSYLENEMQKCEYASQDFDPLFYSENNALSDISEGYLAHYVKRGHRQGLLPVNRILPEIIRDEIRELISIEPDLAALDPDDLRVIKYPVLRPITYLPSQLKNRYGDDMSVVVCVPYISCGGADLISTFILKAYQQRYGKERVLLVVTDKTLNEMPQWIDESSNIVFLSHEKDERGVAEKVHVLHTIVGRLSPERVFNINSRICWEMYEKYGSHLSKETKLNAYLFCHDYDKRGQQVGYIKQYVPGTIKYLNLVFSDNKKILEEINNTYGFTDSQRAIFYPLYVPMIDDNALKSAYGGAAKSAGKILWIGRMARQKRPELLIAIANAMPGYEFEVYGPEGDSIGSDRIIHGGIDNIKYKGVYQNLAEIDFNSYGAFLNTSAWDGLPTILIQMMSIGIPIVTSNVGGISELVFEKTGCLVSEDTPLQYVTELKRVLFTPEFADTKAGYARAHVTKVHNWDDFYASIEKYGGFSDVRTPQSKLSFPKLRRLARS